MWGTILSTFVTLTSFWTCYYRCIMPLFQTMRCCDCLILDSLEFHDGWISGASFMFFLQKKKSHNFIMLTCTTDWKSQIVFPRNGDAEVWIVGKYLSHARWRWQKGSLSYMFCCYSRTTFIRLNLIIANNSTPIFTARCSACAVLAMGLCLSVCLSQVGVLLKRLNVGSLKQNHTIAQGL